MNFLPIKLHLLSVSVVFASFVMSTASFNQAYAVQQLAGSASPNLTKVDDFTAHAQSHRSRVETATRRLEAHSKLIAIWPVLGQSRLSSEFGKRRHPIKNAVIMHQGIDLSAPRGTPILVVAAGTVTYAGWRNGYGRTVEVRHPSGWTTVYAHAQRILVKKGDVVLQGQSIAKVGSSGDVTGPHLHFEVRRNDRPIDPLSLYPEGYALVMQSL